MTLHLVDARQRRSLPEPCAEAVDGIGFAHRKHVDAAVAQVHGMATQLQRQGLLARVRTESHALHAAGDHEARCMQDGHLAPAAEAFSPPPVPSTTAASSSFVTGPMKRLATVPSGAITCVIGRPRGVGKSAGGS